MKLSAIITRVLALAGLIALFHSSALAHTALTHATPGDGALVNANPSEISLEFTGPVTLVKFELMGTGHEMETEFKMDPEAKARFTVTTPGMHPGDFTVNWSVIGADGHTVSDSYSFKVDPDAADEHAGSTEGHH